MKAVSVKQPWANMIAEGEKTIETRTWSTDYRGDILIVSAKDPDIPPAGYALAVATLVDCRPMSVLDEPAAQCRKYPGAFSWVLENVRRVKPFPLQGQLKLFEVDTSGVEGLNGAV
jgi:ASCH domain